MDLEFTLLPEPRPVNEKWRAVDQSKAMRLTAHPAVSNRVRHPGRFAARMRGGRRDYSKAMRSRAPTGFKSAAVP